MAPLASYDQQLAVDASYCCARSVGRRAGAPPPWVLCVADSDCVIEATAGDGGRFGGRVAVRVAAGSAGQRCDGCRRTGDARAIWRPTDPPGAGW